MNVFNIMSNQTNTSQNQNEIPLYSKPIKKILKVWKYHVLSEEMEQRETLIMYCWEYRLVQLHWESKWMDIIY